MWIEIITDFWVEKFPIQKSGLFWWFLKIFCFLFVVWFSGILAYAFDGILIRYVYNLELHASFFGNGIIIFYGTRGFRSFLEWLPKWARPILKLDKAEFKKFFEKGERWASSFFPVFLFALAMTLINFYASPQTIVEGLTAHSAWNLAFIFFLYLLVGTGIWIIVSLWLIIFWVSRQPLNLQLSPQASKTFRPLAIPSLYAAVCFFLAISIVPFFYPPTSITDLVIYGLFIMFGALAFLIPFYNIHLVLIRLKKHEQLKIDEETNELMRELNEALAKHQNKNITTITARLLALQIREKSVTKAEEWPVNIRYFSALSGIALMALGRLIVELVMRIL